ncbi:MAG TPA: MATE family efflux transporter [Gemmataceae bacterium]|nr:MATE family efflux transporter [Gemmataceae bacterium]
MNGGSEKEGSIGEMAIAHGVNGQQERCTLPLAVTRTADLPSASRPTEGSWSRLFASDSAKHALALMDQAVVSGTSFLTTIFVGRSCAASELGIYALGFSLLVSWGCVHQSLIALPYTIYRHRSRSGTEEEYAGSALIHNGLLSALAVVALVIGAVFLSLGGTVAGLGPVLLALAGVIPFALLREFGRRFAFAHLRMGQALLLDMTVAAVQLPGLAWLASMGALSATTAYAAFGLGCALTSGIWLYLDRSYFVIRWNSVGSTLEQSWSLGRWLFASQATVWLQAYFVHWLLACVVGTTATGVYAACMTVVMFSNPLLLGISNSLAPRAAQAFVEGGGPRLRRVVLHTTLLLGSAMVLFCGVVFVAGEDIMSLLYHGSQYEGHGRMLAVLALAMLASALGMPASNGLAAAERPDFTFKAGLLAIVFSVVLVPWLVLNWGVEGATYGFLAGTVAGSLGRWVGFLAVLRQRARSQEAPPLVLDGSEARLESLLPVLQAFLPSAAAESIDWVVEPLNEGVQASLFTVRRRDGLPIGQGHTELAIKLYRPTAQPPVDVVHRQFAALAQFHAKLNGHTVQGWKIQAPIPLYHCERPLALVMTMVPGQSLNSFLKTGATLTAEMLESIVQAVAAAMERYWLIDTQIHGDFNFDNILCEVSTKTISFVDAGIVDHALLCEGVSRRWDPASRDLAYLLFDTTVSVRKTLGNPAMRRRQQQLLEQVLRAFLQRIGPSAEKSSLLEEIEACSRIQLHRLQGSWSPRGLWRRFVRRTASRQMDQVFGRLRSETAYPRSDLPPDGPGRILAGVFETFDRAGIPYCVLHGYESYPERVKSDVDCMISADTKPGLLAALLVRNRDRIGADIVHFRHYRGYFIVLAGKHPEGSPCYVHLDLRVDYEMGDLQFYRGSEVLQSRHRYRSFWVPATSVEFGCYLVRKIAKGTLDDEQGQRLYQLYQQDPAGCREQVARFWGSRSTALLIAAASSGDWGPVRSVLDALGREVRRRAFFRRPVQVIRTWLGRTAGRAKRCFRPDSGLHVVFLGPDGAGKSSVIGAVRRQLVGAFPKTARYSFPPALLGQLYRRGNGPDQLPHAAPPRSWLASVSRAVLYWFVYHSVGYYGTVRLALASSTLVLHDRHLVDALVDPRRYRYAGPSWLLRLIWRFIPKPDLVILLDAPPEILQARKQEVPFAETSRQHEAYRALVGTFRNGHILDAAQPLEQVIAAVNDVVLRHLTIRLARRFGLQASAQSSKPEEKE